MKKRAQVIFVDGPRQSGKTYFINEVSKILEASKLKVAVIDNKMSLQCSDTANGISNEIFNGFLDQLRSIQMASVEARHADVVFIHQSFLSFAVKMMSENLTNDLFHKYHTYLQFLQGYESQMSFLGFIVFQPSEIGKNEEVGLWEQVKNQLSEASFANLTYMIESSQSDGAAQLILEAHKNRNSHD